MRKKRKVVRHQSAQSSFSIKTILAIIVIVAVITLIFNQGIIPTPAPSIEEPAIERVDLLRLLWIGFGVIIAGLVVFWRELRGLMRKHLKIKTVLRKLFWK